jgi:hypothetical protein
MAFVTARLPAALCNERILAMPAGWPAWRRAGTGRRPNPAGFCDRAELDKSGGRQRCVTAVSFVGGLMLIVSHMGLGNNLSWAVL